MISLLSSRYDFTGNKQTNSLFFLTQHNGCGVIIFYSIISQTFDQDLPSPLYLFFDIPIETAWDKTTNQPQVQTHTSNELRKFVNHTGQVQCGHTCSQKHFPSSHDQGIKCHINILTNRQQAAILGLHICGYWLYSSNSLASAL